LARLIAPEEQSRRLLWVERRTEPSQRLLGPVLWRAFGANANIEAFGRNKHPVGIFEGTRDDTVDPNREGFAECGTRLLGRADEIGDHGTTRSHIHPMRRACSMRSAWVKPRSRERFARTASALNTTALRSGASAVASVVLPAPGRPMMRILRIALLSSAQLKKLDDCGSRCGLLLIVTSQSVAAPDARALWHWGKMHRQARCPRTGSLYYGTTSVQMHHRYPRT